MRRQRVFRQPRQEFEPLAALCAIAIVLALTAMIALSGRAGADTVTLRPESLVKGPEIVLGDVADIEGANAVALSAVPLGPAAQPGTIKRLSTAILASRVKTAGIDLNGISFGGAQMVNVTTLSNELPRTALVESLRDFILANMPWKNDEAEVDVPQPLEDVVLPDGALAITWHANPEYRYIGAGGFRGEIAVDGKTQRTVMLRANINAYADVLVAKNEITRGKPARPEDFETRRELLNNLSRESVREPMAVAGKIARKTLFAGQTVKTSDFEAPQVIKRNQLVHVETRAGSLAIQSQAVAMNDAKAGDLLQCSNPSSNQQFQGIVLADGTVVVQ